MVLIEQLAGRLRLIIGLLRSNSDAGEVAMQLEGDGTAGKGLDFASAFPNAVMEVANRFHNFQLTTRTDNQRRGSHPGRTALQEWRQLAGNQTRQFNPQLDVFAHAKP